MPTHPRRLGIILIPCLISLACVERMMLPVEPPARSARVRSIASGYRVTDIGVYGTGAQALAIDKHGTILGRYTQASGVRRSFRWTESDGFADLGDFEGNPFLVYGTNDHQQVNGSTVTSTVPAVQRAVAWLPHRGFLYLDDGYAGSSGGSNDRGQIAGTRFAAGTSAAWIWSEETGARLIPLAIPERIVLSSAGRAINGAGAVVGTVTSQTSGGPANTRTIRAYFWDPDRGTIVIPPLGPPSAGPWGAANVGVTFVGDDGLVLGASEMQLPAAPGPRPNPLASSPGAIPVHAWKWSAERGLVDLGTLGGKHSVAWHADRNGSIYGWASDASGRQHAVRWDEGGAIVDLGTLGGSTLIGGLNKHGVVVGWSTGPDGATHALRFDPVR